LTASPDRILVPLDRSSLAEHAIPYAAALAGPGGRLLLLEVVPDPEPAYGLFGKTVIEEDLLLRVCVDGARGALEVAARRWGGLAPGTDIEVAVGDPADEILRVATERRCGVIAMASHGRGSLGRWTYGSVADRVVRAADRPVLVVRAHDREPALALPTINRLVVPLDGSAVAERALPVAAVAADRLRVPLRLVLALDVRTLADAASTGVYPETVLLRSLDPLRAAATGYLQGQAERLEASGHRVSHEVREGSPGDELLAATEPTDLVAMTTHGRGGVHRWLLGSVADKLVRHGRAPVLLVRAGATPDAAPPGGGDHEGPEGHGAHVEGRDGA
jgi:nucleotide-binding universal stress UspA family protein